MEKRKQPPLDKPTTDLVFGPKPMGNYLLPQKYPTWDKIKAKLENLAKT